MMRLEQAWARDLLGAFVSCEDAEFVVDAADVDYLAALRSLQQHATPKARVGLRLALWLVALAPVWHWGRLRTFFTLERGEQRALLEDLLRLRSLLPREAVAVLKLAAALALFGTESVRARTGCDVVQVTGALAGPGGRLRLPLLSEPANQIGRADGTGEAA